MFKKSLEQLLKGVPTGGKKKIRTTLDEVLKKANKEKGITGKPKGRSPSMVLGSSSKAGLQNKQKSPFNVKVEYLNDMKRKGREIGRERRRLKPKAKPNPRMMKRGGKAKK